MTPSGERTEAPPPVAAVTPTLKPEPVTHPSPAAQLAPALAAVSTSLPAADGTRSVTVQLHPDSLGQVRVQIDQTAGGAARVAVTAERPETLNLLRHDAPALLNALDQAGVPATGRVVSFQVEPSSIPSAGPGVGHGDHRANEGDSRSTGAGPGDEAWRRGGDDSTDQDERANQGGRRTWRFRSGLDITA
jgi:flagellar hook-length control protein FliK